ncbi:MAG TPA: response regulator [Candidatus Wallbacteria bacterium]|nr:response regulator [Candidatus Wallbacteria bacterium]
MALKKALVVDDTKNIRVLLKTCLELEGFEVFTASDATVAIELLKNTQMDIAFIDIKMPEISGTELLKKMRDNGSKTPVIIMTAFASIKNAVECTKMGAIAYLQKPFTANKIRALLGEIWPDGHKEDLAGSFEGCDTGYIESLIISGKNKDAIAELKKLVVTAPECAELYRLFYMAYSAIGERELADKFLSMYELIIGKGK